MSFSMLYSAILQTYFQCCKMQTDDDCGPVVVSTITGEPLKSVMNKWPYGFNGNKSDSPFHHDIVCKELGGDAVEIKISDVLSGKTTPGKTAVLINMFDDPRTILPENLIYMHWVVVLGNTLGTNGSEDRIELVWGDGTVRSITKERMIGYTTHPLSMAYIFVRGENTVEWYKRLWAWFCSILPWSW